MSERDTQRNTSAEADSGPPDLGCETQTTSMQTPESASVPPPDIVNLSNRSDVLATFPFLKLPPEIRNMIYKELLVVGKVFYSPQYDMGRLFFQQRYDDYHLFPKPEVSLLRVCKQFHTEAELLYLSSNHFVLPLHCYKYQPFNSLETLPNDPYGSIGRFLFSQKGLSHVRSVSFAFYREDIRQGTYSWSKEYRFLAKLFDVAETIGPAWHVDKCIDRIRRLKEYEIIVSWLQKWNHIFETTQPFNYIELDFSNLNHLSSILNRCTGTILPALLDSSGLQMAENSTFHIIQFDWYSGKVTRYDLSRVMSPPRPDAGGGGSG